MKPKLELFDMGRYGEWPGAYRLIKARETDQHGNICHYEFARVEELHCTEEARQEAKRRAALVTAAPELLKQLQSAASYLEGYRVWLESDANPQMVPGRRNEASAQVRALLKPIRAAIDKAVANRKVHG